MRKMTNIKAEYFLNEAAIDEISEKVSEFLEVLNVEKKKRLRLRLSVEEMLLNWKDFFGREQKITLKLGIRLRKPFIILETAGEEFNPIHSSQQNEWMNRLLSGLELEPTYTYQKKKNVVTIYPEKKKKGMLYWLAWAVFLGILACICTGWIPQQMKMEIVESVITPTMDVYFGMIGMLAGPLIFLSVFTGISGIGDMATFSKIGKNVVLRSLFYSLLGAVVTAVISVPIFQLKFEKSASSASAAGELFQMILDIFPTNLVNPFLTGNTMQIIAMAIALGAVALVLGSSMSGILGVCEQLQNMISILMGWLCNLIPAVIFLTILQNVWSGSGSVILSGWKPILQIVILLAGMFVGQIGWVCFKLKLDVKDYLKKIMPAAVIGFTTASSSAAFTEMNDTAVEKLGIDKVFAGFAIPLYMVLMGLVNSIVFYTNMVYAAVNYDVSISLGWMVTAVVTVTLLSSATPPVSGAGLTIYTVLFAQMGIPSAAIPILLTLEMIADFLATGVKVALIENETLLNARKNQLCDY